jgi:hypothetical protein
VTPLDWTLTALVVVASASYLRIADQDRAFFAKVFKLGLLLLIAWIELVLGVAFARWVLGLNIVGL